MNTQAGVEIAHLRKAYRDVVAVDDVSFSVAEGEIFGILGPNGAGKTTTVECVLGLRSPDAGSIRVLGLDPGQDREDLHLIVGAQLQESAQPGKLRVGEILDLYRSFYAEPADVGEFTTRSVSPGSSRTTTGPCRAASGSGCPSRWPSSAGRRSPSSTR